VFCSGHGEAVPPFSQYPVREDTVFQTGLPTNHSQEAHESIGIASNLGYHILQLQGWLVAFSKRAGVVWKSGHGEAVPPFPPYPVIELPSWSDETTGDEGQKRKPPI